MFSQKKEKRGGGGAGGRERDLSKMNVTGSFSLFFFQIQKKKNTKTK
ncbi:MAG: hypothetical protein Pars93KO_28610 [Parasphingorhabdus sp.]